MSESNLKEILFKRAKIERDKYLEMIKDDSFSSVQQQSQLQRFNAVYHVINNANLDYEYEIWLKKK